MEDVQKTCYRLMFCKLVAHMNSNTPGEIADNQPHGEDVQMEDGMIHVSHIRVPLFRKHHRLPTTHSSNNPTFNNISHLSRHKEISLVNLSPLANLVTLEGDSGVICEGEGWVRWDLRGVEECLSEVEVVWVSRRTFAVFMTTSA